MTINYNLLLAALAHLGSELAVLDQPIDLYLLAHPLLAFEHETGLGGIKAALLVLAGRLNDGDGVKLGGIRSHHRKRVVRL